LCGSSSIIISRLSSVAFRLSRVASLLLLLISLARLHMHA
jgi:hypothetical protein